MLSFNQEILDLKFKVNVKMREIVRKSLLAINWGMLGGSGIFLCIGGLFSPDTGLFLGMGIVALILAFIIQKTINWIFE